MLFREEALSHYRRGPADDHLLELGSPWAGIAYWLICAMFVALVVAASIIPLHHYAAGPAVIRALEREEVTASESGTLIRVFVKPDEIVERGKPLAELDSRTEALEVQRAQDQFNRMQARLLRDPADQGTRAALPRLHAERDFAEERLKARQVLSPRAGRILDLHLRIGQQLQAGDVVASLADAESFVVVALLPGYARPELQQQDTSGAQNLSGKVTTIRLELEGYRSSYLDLPISSVSSEIVGPELARRELGTQVADALKLDGPMARIEARIPQSTFTHDGHEYDFYDGMRATAEVRTHSERALLVLIPGLREARRRVFGR